MPKSELTAFWWRPGRNLRSLIGESAKHGLAWAHLLIKGPTRPRNFGDAFSPIALAELSGRRLAWRPISDADIVCIGSLLNLYIREGSQALILGSGLRKPLDGKGIQPDKVLFVRGKWTAAQLELPSDTARGDPGLLVSSMVPTPARRLGVTVIPHFSELQYSGARVAIRRLAQDCKVVLPNEEPLTVAKQIAASDLVLTSSLHAVIFADALGIPVRRITFGVGRSREPSYKYADYDSIFGLGSEVVSSVDVSTKAAQYLAIDQLSERTSQIAQQLPEVVENIYAGSRDIL